MEAQLVIEPLPELASYDRFKAAVMETIPAAPWFIRRQLEHDANAIGLTAVRWRTEPVRKKIKDKDYWLMYADSQYHGPAFELVYKSVLCLGCKYRGWTFGVNPGWQGLDDNDQPCWLITFSVAVLAL